MLKIWITALLAITACQALHAQSPGHIIVIGVDGMSPDGVEQAPTPVMDSLMQAGAYTLHARGVMPTVSSPNWASMIMGAGPEQHGILSNDWEPHKPELAPVTQGARQHFPTIYGILRDQQPKAGIACFHDWDGYGRLIEKGVCDRLQHCKGPDSTLAAAAQYFKEQRPTFLFVHLDHVDHAGHELGHGTPAYYASVAKADSLIGDMIQAVRQTGELPQTVFLITADHGGLGKKHGGNTLAEIEIPWIICGKGVKTGHVLSVPVNTYDTAATIAWLFHLQTPDAWIGKPVKEAFTGNR